MGAVWNDWDSLSHLRVVDWCMETAVTPRHAEPMEMQQIATLKFTDLETAGDAVAICRAKLGEVGICLSLGEGPDTEVFLSTEDCRKLVDVLGNALIIASGGTLSGPPIFRNTADSRSAMYERFTDRARKVMQLANHEAQRFNRACIDTEQILVALMKEGEGVAAVVLKGLGISLQKIRGEIEKIVPSGPDRVLMGRMPLTAHATQIIENAQKEAAELQHSYIGTEHLLLGLTLQKEGVAAKVLANLGVKLDDIHREVLNLLGHGL